MSLLPKIQYDFDTKLQKKSLDFISQINNILDSEDFRNETMTIRQLHYGMVSRNLTPNTQKSYNQLAKIIKKGRYCGLIDWERIEDITRFKRELPHWENQRVFLESVIPQYKKNLWTLQNYYVQIWCEKDAVFSTINKIAEKYRVPCFSCRGFSSTSSLWKASEDIIRKNKDCVIIYVGDHDPSGVFMPNDIKKRLNEFLTGHFNHTLTIEHCALTLDQIRQFKIPKQFAKVKDKRTMQYVKTYDTTNSWELDALPPKVLMEIIEQTLLKYLNIAFFEFSKKSETEERQDLSIRALPAPTQGII